MSYIVQRKSIIGAQMGALQASIDAYDAVTSTAPQISNNVMFLQWLKSVFNRGDGMAAAMHMPTRLTGGGVEDVDMTGGGSSGGSSSTMQGMPPVSALKRKSTASQNGKLRTAPDLEELFQMPATDINGILSNPADHRHAAIRKLYDNYTMASSLQQPKQRADFPSYTVDDEEEEEPMHIPEQRKKEEEEEEEEPYTDGNSEFSEDFMYNRGA
jgi:hypothetical protein